MEKLEKKINISLTKVEYEYLKEMCKSMYGALQKLPKKMRTPKFYVLENMTKYTFNE